MNNVKAAFDAEIAQAEERYCDAQVRGATYIDPAEYCEDEATHEGDDGGWYCDAHQADEPDPDRDRTGPGRAIHTPDRADHQAARG